MHNYILFFLKEIKDIVIVLLQQIKSLKDINNNEFKKFFFKNKNTFKKFYNDKSLKKEGIILTTAYNVGHPGYQITQMILGKYLEKILKIKTIGSQEQNHFFVNKLFESYGYNQIHVFKRMSFFERLKLFHKSKKILANFKKIDNFVNYEKDGVKIGKIVYEHYIRFTGQPYLYRFNFKINYFLFRALEYHAYSKELFKKNNIKYVIISEKQFIPSGIIFQNALLNKSKIIARLKGPSNVGLRLYDNKNEFYKSRYHFSKDILEYTYKNHLKTCVINSNKILKARFSCSNSKKFEDIKDVKLAFKSKKKFTKKTLCEKLGWDEKKPIAIIFDQHYLDGIFDCNRWYFKDHLDWIRSTFTEIKKIKNVNWLIKPHPLDPYEIHSATTGTEEEFKKIIGNIENIKIFPNNYSAEFLPKIASAILTGSGTPGIEYPCFGIPCILSNESHYSGNGFTIEPKTRGEYFKYLNNINSLKKLNNEQILRAKNFMYLEIIGGRSKIPLLPKYDIGHKFFSKGNSKKFWAKCGQLASKYNIKNDQFINILRKQIQSKSKHLVNRAIINYYAKKN
jgi:hypothetical protein